MTRLSRACLLSVLVVTAAGAAACAGRVNDEVWQPFAAWALATRIGLAIAQSEWLFAVIESFHLVGLALLGGAVLIVDFRLLGLGMHDAPTARLARDAERWMNIGLGIMLVSGSLLFASEGTKFYSSGFWNSAEAPFVYKMLFLLLAIMFTFTIRRRHLARFAEASIEPSSRDRLVAVTSMFLWFGVGACGRGIGFY